MFVRGRGLTCDHTLVEQPAVPRKVLDIFASVSYIF